MEVYLFCSSLNFFFKQTDWEFEYDFWDCKTLGYFSNI